MLATVAAIIKKCWQIVSVCFGFLIFIFRFLHNLLLPRGVCATFRSIAFQFT